MTAELHWEVIPGKRDSSLVIKTRRIMAHSHLLVLRTYTREKKWAALPRFER